MKQWNVKVGFIGGEKKILYVKVYSVKAKTEEEAEQAQAVSQQMQENQLTSELMEKEQQLNQVLTDINQTIMKPIQELYQ